MKIIKNPVAKYLLKYNKPKIEKNKKKEFKNNGKLKNNGDESRHYFGEFIYA